LPFFKDYPFNSEKKYNILLKEEAENVHGRIEANAGFIDTLCWYAVEKDSKEAEKLWFGTNKEKINILLDQLDERTVEGLLRLSEKLVNTGMYAKRKPEQTVFDNGFDTFAVAMNFILAEQLEMLDKILRYNQMFIAGKPMYELYKFIADKFDMKRCFAMSYKDLHYWRTPAAEHWLAANKRMVKRGVRVERTFVISDRAELVHSIKNQMVLRKHIVDLGIKVRLLIDTTGFSRRFPNPGKELEFSVYDHKLALYWNHEWGIYLEVWFNDKEVRRCLNNYETASTYCEIVPNKITGDNRLFESEDEFNAWLSNR